MSYSQYILIDLGKVLLDWNPEYLYEKLIPDQKRRKFFLDEVCNLEWHDAHNRGVSFARNATSLISRYPEYRDEIRAWFERWPEQFSGYIDGMDVLVQSLARNDAIGVYGLSNMPKEVWSFMQIAFPAIGLLEDTIISGQVGTVKPDPEIYHLAWDMMGRPDKTKVLFIDDTFENVAAAKKFGFVGHHFKNKTGLVKALNRLPAITDTVL